MKKTLLALLIMIIVFMMISQENLHAQNKQSIKEYLAGNWTGMLKVQVYELTIFFRFNLNENDSLTAVLDSPDQGAKDILVDGITYENDTLILTVSSVKGTYTGIINLDDTLMKGKWMQSGMELDLDLTKVETLPELNRPQEPKPPYPYKVEELSFDNTEAGIKLAGTLTLPESEGPFPAVILVSGSGPQNRNEELMGHKPFLVIADYLTKNNIAVLRYDDRGIGDSEGNFSSSTSVDFASDVAAAFEFLKSHKQINHKKIGIAGHSEGGLIAPMIAAENKEVAFIILLAGPGLAGEEILIAQTELILKAEGTDEKEIAKLINTNRKIYKVLKSTPDNDKAGKKIRKIAMKTIDKTDQASKARIEQSIGVLTSVWYRYFLTYDPYPALTQVQCPVMALIGENDLQVPAKKNLEFIEKALQEGGNTNYLIKELKGLNHLFQTSETGSPGEYSKIEETFAPEALEIITKWILEVTR
ncbi:alpha/beta hydrolase family protein [Bacteroidota bacterium]